MFPQNFLTRKLGQTSVFYAVDTKVELQLQQITITRGREVNPLMHITSENGQTHFKNLAAFAARFLKCVWPFWDVMQCRNWYICERPSANWSVYICRGRNPKWYQNVHSTKSLQHWNYYKRMHITNDGERWFYLVCGVTSKSFTNKDCIFHDFKNFKATLMISLIWKVIYWSKSGQRHSPRSVLSKSWF